MNGAQLHLAINHFPVVILFISLLTGLWGWISKKVDVLSVSSGLIIMGSLFTAVTYYTGEPAEEVIEKQIKDIDHFIEEHEEAGKYALILSLATGLSAFTYLLLQFRNKSNSRLRSQVLLLMILLNAVSFITLLRTAHLGGLIHHEEIRPSSTHN